MTAPSRVGTLATIALLVSMIGCSGKAPGSAGGGQDEAMRRSHLQALGDKYLAFRVAHDRSPASTQEFVAHVRQGEVDEILEVALVKLESGNIEMVWNGKQILSGGHPYVWAYEKQTELASGYVLLSTFAVIEATREEFAELERLPQAP